jgi:hypothetical protein
MCLDLPGSLRSVRGNELGSQVKVCAVQLKLVATQRHIGRAYKTLCSPLLGARNGVKEGVKGKRIPILCNSEANFEPLIARAFPVARLDGCRAGRAGLTRHHGDKPNQQQANCKGTLLPVIHIKARLRNPNNLAIRRMANIVLALLILTTQGTPSATRLIFFKTPANCQCA